MSRTITEALLVYTTETPPAGATPYPLGSCYFCNRRVLSTDDRLEIYEMDAHAECHEASLERQASLDY